MIIIDFYVLHLYSACLLSEDPDINVLSPILSSDKRLTQKVSIAEQEFEPGSPIS